MVGGVPHQSILLVIELSNMHLVLQHMSFPCELLCRAQSDGVCMMMMLISNDGDDGTQSLQQLDVGVNSLCG